MSDTASSSSSSAPSPSSPSSSQQSQPSSNVSPSQRSTSPDYEMKSPSRYRRYRHNYYFSPSQCNLLLLITTLILFLSFNPAEGHVKSQTDNKFLVPLSDLEVAPSELLERDGRDGIQFASGPAFDLYVQHHKRQADRLSLARRGLTPEDLNYSDHELYQHPLRPGRHPLLWRFQFVLLIAALVAVYLFQVAFDFQVTKKLTATSRVSTILLLGANFRDIGETKLVSFARFITCVFLHGHVFHLVVNVLTLVTAWTYLSHSPAAATEAVWVFHWTLPIFMLSAICGSFYSYCTTLKVVGLSIGASGGGLGFSAAFTVLTVFFEGVPPHRRLPLLRSVFWVVFGCVPWDSLFSKTQGTQLDVGAHLAGAGFGVVCAVVCGLIYTYVDHTGTHLVTAGDVLSIILLVLIVFAFAEVTREFFVDGKELIVRAYVKWLALDETLIENDRRHTANGRINCDVLTDDYLFLLETEGLEDDPEVILERLRMEADERRMTCPDLGGLCY